MLTVILPVVVLFAIILLPVPKIGGDARIGLLAAAVLAFLFGRVGIPAAATAAIGGIDRIAWLSVFPSLAVSMPNHKYGWEPWIRCSKSSGPSLVVLPRAS